MLLCLYLGVSENCFFFLRALFQKQFLLFNRILMILSTVVLFRGKITKYVIVRKHMVLTVLLTAEALACYSFVLNSTQNFPGSNANPRHEE